MSLLISTARPLTRPLLWVALLVGLLIGGTGVLWAYYGTAVFFELVRAGWAACF